MLKLKEIFLKVMKTGIDFITHPFQTDKNITMEH